MEISLIFEIILCNGGHINTKTNTKWDLKSLSLLFTMCGKTDHNLHKMY